jgi:hypothetical protein
MACFDAPRAKSVHCWINLREDVSAVFTTEAAVQDPECFQVKWAPVHRPEARQDKDMKSIVARIKSKTCPTRTCVVVASCAIAVS